MMEADREKILAINSLLIGYGKGKNTKPLLPPLSSSVVRGELIALIGQNGIGKSTLLRTITGLHKPLGGMVSLKGRNIQDYTRYELASNIGYISTEPVRVSNMTVFDLASLGRYPHTNWAGRLSGSDIEVIYDAINKVGLHNLTGRYINELSDGERQRAMIARLLAQDAGILVMDEPTAYLDIKGRYEIIHLLHDLSRSRGKTIIFSTHDLKTAISECDKIWIMLKDSFTEGAPEDLILNGDFSRLFNSPVVIFSEGDASFSFKREMRGSISLDAEGIVRYWTEKAANRSGFEISDDHPHIRIKVTADEDGLIWYVYLQSMVLEFNSVYDLVSWLNKAVIS